MILRMPERATIGLNPCSVPADEYRAAGLTCYPSKGLTLSFTGYARLIFEFKGRLHLVSSGLNPGNLDVSPMVTCIRMNVLTTSPLPSSSRKGPLFTMVQSNAKGGTGPPSDDTSAPMSYRR